MNYYLQDGDSEMYTYYLHFRVIHSKHHLDANHLAVHVASKSEHRGDRTQVLVTVLLLRQRLDCRIMLLYPL